MQGVGKPSSNLTAPTTFSFPFPVGASFLSCGGSGGFGNANMQAAARRGLAFLASALLLSAVLQKMR
jgi:hypothetical protein